jgi:hypothetical protein
MELSLAAAEQTVDEMYHTGPATAHPLQPFQWPEPEPEPEPEPAAEEEKAAAAREMLRYEAMDTPTLERKLKERRQTRDLMESLGAPTAAVDQDIARMENVVAQRLGRPLFARGGVNEVGSDPSSAQQHGGGGGEGGGGGGGGSDGVASYSELVVNQESADRLMRLNRLKASRRAKEEQKQQQQQQQLEQQQQLTAQRRQVAMQQEQQVEGEAEREAAERLARLNRLKESRRRKEGEAMRKAAASPTQLLPSTLVRVHRYTPFTLALVVLQAGGCIL